MGVLESQSFMCWFFTSLLLSMEVKGIVTKDSDLFVEFVQFIRVAANFQCYGVDFV